MEARSGRTKASPFRKPGDESVGDCPLRGEESALVPRPPPHLTRPTDPNRTALTTFVWKRHRTDKSVPLARLRVSVRHSASREPSGKVAEPCLRTSTGGRVSRTMPWIGRCATSPPRGLSTPITGEVSARSSTPRVAQRSATSSSRAAQEDWSCCASKLPTIPSRTAADRTPRAVPYNTILCVARSGRPSVRNVAPESGATCARVESARALRARSASVGQTRAAVAPARPICDRVRQERLGYP